VNGSCADQDTFRSGSAGDAADATASPALSGRVPAVASAPAFAIGRALRLAAARMAIGAAGWVMNIEGGILPICAISSAVPQGRQSPHFEEADPSAVSLSFHSRKIQPNQHLARAIGGLPHDTDAPWPAGKEEA
jgi:hypothetical protein